MTQNYGDDLLQIAPNGSSIHVLEVPTLADRDRIGTAGPGLVMRPGGIVKVTATSRYYELLTTAPTWADRGPSLFAAGTEENPALEPSGSYTIHVDNVSGNDDTGNGSALLPYATKRRAIASLPAKGAGDRRFLVFVHFTGQPYQIGLVDKVFENTAFVQIHHELEAPLFSGALTFTEITPGVWEANTGTALPAFARGEAVLNLLGLGIFGTYPDNYALPVLDTGVSPNIRVVSDIDPGAFGVVELARIQVELISDDAVLYPHSFTHRTNVVVAVSCARIPCAFNDTYGVAGPNSAHFMAYYGVFLTGSRPILSGCDFYGATDDDSPRVERGTRLLGADFAGGVFLTDGECTVGAARVWYVSGGSFGTSGCLVRSMTLHRPGINVPLAVTDGAQIVIWGPVEAETGLTYVSLISASKGGSVVYRIVTGGGLAADPTSGTTIQVGEGGYMVGLADLLARPSTSMSGPAANEVQAGIAPSIDFATFLLQGGSNDFALGDASHGSKVI